MSRGSESQGALVYAGSGKNRKIRCLFIVPTLKRAGAESQLVDLVNRLSNDLFEKTVVVLEDNLDQLNRLHRASLEFVCLPKKRFLDKQLIAHLASIIDRRQIDVVHCTMQYSALIGWLALRKSQGKPKLVAAIHTTLNVGLKEELFDRLVFRRVLRRCNHIIFVCDYQRRFWLDKYPELGEHSSVVYNGVDPEEFVREDYIADGLALRKKLKWPDSSYIFACVAGFRKEKGHRILLEAFAGLPERARLLLAGDGPLRTETESLAEKMHLGERVVFLGNLTDVRPVLAITDAFVLPSTAVETFSMAMLEAMAMQVPVIASDIGGLREAIEDGRTGSLLEPGNIGRLRSTMESYMRSEALDPLDAKPREIVIERFTADQMTTATQACLMNVCGR